MLDLFLHIDILTLEAIHHQTRGSDILKIFSNVIEEFELDMTKCISITTDGAPNMIGKANGFVALLRSELAECGSLLGLHCIIHAETLCSKAGTENLNSIVEDITKIINFIRGKALIHREFGAFLKEIESEYSDVIFYTEVRWLSKGLMAKRFLQLIPKIRAFFTLF